MQYDNISREKVRHASISSSSSVGSVKPLEWDSGADIGYRRVPASSKLSTFERIALVQGKASISNKKCTNFSNVVKRSIRDPISVSTPICITGEETGNSDDGKLDHLKDSHKDEIPQPIPVVDKDNEPLRYIGRNLNQQREIKTRNHKSINSKSDNSSASDVSSRYSITFDGQNFCYIPTSSKSNTNESHEVNSFEYIPGTLVNKSSTSESENSNLNNRVSDGIEMVLQYVEKMNDSDRSKVLKKIAHKLKHLNMSENTENSSIGEVSTQYTTISGNSSCRTFIKKTSINITEKEDETETTWCTETISKEGSIGKNSSSSSSIYEDGKTDTTLDTPVNSRDVGVVELKGAMDIPLKEYFAREKETQLLWIKSGIEHLKNLKRLYESQKKFENQFKVKMAKKSRRSGRQVSKNSVALSENNKEQIRREDNAIAISSSSVDSIRNYDKLRQGRKFCRRHDKENEPLQKNKEENTENLTNKKPEYFTVSFKSKTTRENKDRHVNKEKPILKQQNAREISASKNYLVPNSVKRPSTLQEYLRLNRPGYVNRAQYRRQCLMEIAHLRELRNNCRQQLAEAVQNLTIENDRIKKTIIAPPLEVKKIFDQRTIRQQTEKKYQKLPEVQMRKAELERKERYKTNQIMAKVFTKKLQKKVLKGQVNFSNMTNILAI